MSGIFADTHGDFSGCMALHTALLNWWLFYAKLLTNFDLFCIFFSEGIDGKVDFMIYNYHRSRVNNLQYWKELELTGMDNLKALPLANLYIDVTNKRRGCGNSLVNALQKISLLPF